MSERIERVEFDAVNLTDTQADGLACVVCNTTYFTADVPHVPVGVVAGVQVFACTSHIEPVTVPAVAAMPCTVETSVCPSWCTRTDHAGENGFPRPTHITHLGRVLPGDSLFESVSVSLVQNDGADAVVSVHVDRRGITADERMMWLDSRDAKCFAAAMDVLGHTDVGDLVRQAITTIETEVSR